MSSKAKKIAKNVSNQERVKRYYVMGTLAGSAALSIGKLSGKSEKEIIDGFEDVKDRFPPVKNVVEMCDFFIEEYGMDEKYKSNLVLVYDERNIMTPLVTVKYHTEDGDILCPIPSDGTYTGILAYLDNEWTTVEYVYDEDEE